MANEISVLLSLTTAGATAKLNAFINSASAGLKELAGEALAAYASFEGFSKMVEEIHSVLELEEAVNLLNQRTGLSVPLIEGLREAASELEVPFENLQTLLQRFSGNIFAAASGQSTILSEAFQRLKISLTDNGALRSTDAILTDVAKKMEGVASGAEKARIAQELFGRGGIAIIPVLNEFSEIQDKIANSPGPITTESAQQAREFGVQMQQLRITIQLLWVEVANNILPTLISLATKFQSLASDTTNAKASVESFTDILKGMVTVAVVIAAVFNAVGKAIGLAFATDLQNIQTLISTVEEVVTDLELFVRDAQANLVGFVAAGIELAQAAANTIKGHYLEASLDLAQAQGLIAKNAANLAGDALKIATDSTSGVKQMLNTQLDAYTKYFADIKSRYASVSSFLASIWNPSKPSASGKTSSTASQSPDSLDLGTSKETLQLSKEQNEIYKQLFQQSEKLINANPFVTQLEKMQQLIPLLDQERTLLQLQISQAQYNEDNAKTDQDRLNAQKELVSLQGQLNDLDEKWIQIMSKSTIVGQVESQFTDILNKSGNFSQDLGKTINSAFTGVNSGLDKAFNDMFLRNGKAAQDFTIGLLTSMRTALSSMLANWITTHVLMEAVSIAFNGVLYALRVESSAQFLAKTGLDVLTHSAGEQLKTEISAEGSVARMLLVGVETAFNVLMTGVKVIAHIGGEVLMTAATVIQSGIRVAIIIAEAIVYIIKAAVQAMSALADIPYVGPALAIGALAAVLAAGYGAIAGRESGGPVEAGTPYVVGERRPELFVPSQSGYILPNVPTAAESINALASQSSNTTQMNIAVHNWNDEAAMRDFIKNDPDTHHVILDKVNRNAHNIPSRVA